MANTILISTVDKNISVRTDIDGLLDKLIEEVPVRIPDGEIVDGVSSIDLDINVLRSESDKFETLSGNKYNLSVSYGVDQAFMDTLRLLTKSVEDVYVGSDTHSLHSSVITNGQEAIVFAGLSSTGKTTTAIRSCLRSKGDIKFYSGDRTVIGGTSVIGGTKRTHLRTGSVLYEIPELQHYLNVQNSEDPWDDLIVVDADKVGIVTDKGPRPIKCVIYPKKVGGDLKVKRIRQDYAMIRLYEGFCFFSDYFPGIMYGQREPLISNLTKEQRKRRVELAEELSKSIPMFSMSGKLDDMAEYVVQNAFR